MKNANGEGSVYKLKGKRRKPWVAVVTAGYDELGKQKRKVLGTFITKKEAQLELIRYLDNPTLFSGKTFKDVVDLWYSNYSKKVSKGRLNNIKSTIKKFNILNDLKIREIKLPILQRIFDDFNQSYGAKTLFKSTLNMIFEFALKNDFIDVNKVSFIELGKNEKVLERKPFTREEINILFKNVDSKDKYINRSYSVLILIYMGMRIGELLNLKVKDINLKNKTIFISESKTPDGIRTIPIPDKIVYLFENNIKPNEEYFIQGSRENKENYQGYIRKFYKMLKLLNLEDHTIHDTRHTFATMLNNADVNGTSIIKLIGHSDFKITQDIYTHKDIEELRKAVNLLN